MDQHSTLTVFNVEGTNSGSPSKVVEGKPVEGHITLADEYIEQEKQYVQ
jgi:hypothetical protein